jgi:4'-phosphopantetheinyl transferase
MIERAEPQQRGKSPCSMPSGSPTDCTNDPHELHVWVIGVDSAEGRAVAGLAVPEEREQEARFVFEDDRALFRCARGLARACLTFHSPSVTPDAWRFERTAHGKPAVVTPRTPLCFNLSHSRDFVACVVGTDVACGIDIECIDRRPHRSIPIDGTLAPYERARLAQAPEEARMDCFVRHWTLKEAYVKARGLGLALPLDAVEVDPTSKPIWLRLHPPIHDDPRAWQLEQRRVGPDYWLSVAVCRGLSRDYRIVDQSHAVRDRLTSWWSRP